MWVNATSICLFTLLRIETNLPNRNPPTRESTHTHTFMGTNGACLVSACIICTYSCCLSGVNVLANWHVPLSERDYTRPLPINCCHHLNGVSNIWELSEQYIFLSAPYWCNRWPVTDYNQSHMMFIALLSYYSMVIHHSRGHFL